MFDLIASVLSWFYGIFPSFGVSIILLTVVVMVIVTPLTLKGTRSMIKMQHLQPEMKKIQNRHKGDRESMNKEMMAFYQANNINPMGGCLPLLIQAPVFMVLYTVLRGLTRRLSDIGDSAGWVAGRMGSGLEGILSGASTAQQTFYPAYLDESSELFRDLASETEMLFLGFDLARTASRALSDSIGAALPYFFLILVVFASSWYQQRQIRGRNPDSTVNPQQQMLMKVMPFFLPVISFSLDAALVLYFVVSNLYRIGQQAYITRTLYGPGGDQPAVVIPERSDGGKKAIKEKHTKGAKPQTKGTEPKGNEVKGDSSRTENQARSRSTKLGRTTAGSNKNSSQISDGEKSKGSSSDSRGSKSLKGRKAGKPASLAKKEGRRGRRNTSDETANNDKRPPAGRSRGGRTTPPGTAGNRGANKKKRRK